MAHHHHKGPELHHICLLSRKAVDGPTGDTGGSMWFLDIGVVLMNFRALWREKGGVGTR